MRIAVGQFAASPDWKDDLTACRDCRRGGAGGADLLVTPEGVLARFTEDRHRIREVAQPLDGPFVTELRAATSGIRTHRRRRHPRTVRRRAVFRHPGGAA